MFILSSVNGRKVFYQFKFYSTLHKVHDIHFGYFVWYTLLNSSLYGGVILLTIACLALAWQGYYYSSFQFLLSCAVDVLLPCGFWFDLPTELFLMFCYHVMVT